MHFAIPSTMDLSEDYFEQRFPKTDGQLDHSRTTSLLSHSPAEKEPEDKLGLSLVQFLTPSALYAWYCGLLVASRSGSRVGR